MNAPFVPAPLPVYRAFSVRRIGAMVLRYRLSDALVLAAARSSSSIGRSCRC